MVPKSDVEETLVAVVTVDRSSKVARQLYVGNIPRTTNNYELQKVFEEHGVVEKVEVYQSGQWMVVRFFSNFSIVYAYRTLTLLLSVHFLPLFLMTYELLNVLEFNSASKRMSIIGHEEFRNYLLLNKGFAKNRSQFEENAKERVNEKICRS
ncbi:unnamed protein product [Lactuca saligna]|uniref:RRM domain-containing protein n=1 Tax=Lactuca saligna TaxID=75948 RepID=A0AA35Z129_LACSI|nr:unnamed protein product [Lactuca saligna]